LDEIGDMPLDAQARLLRVLQFGEVRPVGSDAAHRVDVRVAAATNRALESLVRRGGFREDLYYRLAGVTLQLPPLRERREDVPVLAEHILRKETEREGLAPKRLAADALTALSRHTFPGNVRELENILRAASVMADGAVIRARDLPLRQRAGGAGTGGAAQPGAGARRTALREVDRQFIEEALRKAKGSRTRAAALLGVSRPTLYRKLRDYGLL